MSERLKVIRPSAGHILDIDPLEVADQYLTLARNVNTRKGFPSRIGGRRVAYPVSGGGMPNDPRHLLNLQLNTFNWWMSFGTSTIYAVENGNSYNISYASQIAITDVHEWVSTLLNGIPIFTNGKNPLLYWNGDGSTDALEVDDWPAGTICKAVAAFRYHIFALNIDGPSGTFDNMVMWSNAAEPGALPDSWTPSPSNEAGSAILADTVGRCICAVPLGQQLMVYKPTSIYAFEYMGQQPDNIFTNRAVNRSLGALGPHCVREHGTRQLVVGNDDVVLTDGINVQSIADNRIKLALASSIDETYAQNAFVIRDLNRHETWVCVPESGSQFATLAHVWDEKRDTWTTRDLNQVRYGTTGYVTDSTINSTWDSDSEVWDSDLSAWNAGSTGSIERVVTAESSKLYVEDTADLTSVNATVAKYDMAFDDDSQFKTISRIVVRGSGSGFSTLQFRLGVRNSIDESQAWQPFVMVLKEGNPYEITGRYVSIEIMGTGTALWTIDRIIFEGTYDGHY
jgi:hypothetical protein